MSDRLILVSIGNTRTRIAAAEGTALEPSQVLENQDVGAIAGAIVGMLPPSDAHRESRIVIAAVNAPLAGQLEKQLIGALSDGKEATSSPDTGALTTHRGVRILRFGRDLPVPIPTTLDDDRSVGQDRLLDALGAFSRSKQACIVIDAGTAVTVDFVDGEGVFHGGAIAPGVRMMARALHQHTSALPEIDVHAELARIASKPGQDLASEIAEGSEQTGPVPFGKRTSEAIAIGVAAAVRGMAHTLIDRYAQFYNAYPRVIATGGDAPLLFEHDDLVEIVVPDLPLVGMLAAVHMLRDAGDDDEHENDR